MAISTQEMSLTQELHRIRANLYYYSSLLSDLSKSIEFIRRTKNPALPTSEGDEILERECSNLLAETHRLEMGRKMQDYRLKNVMNLVG